MSPPALHLPSPLLPAANFERSLRETKGAVERGTGIGSGAQTREENERKFDYPRHLVTSVLHPFLSQEKGMGTKRHVLKIHV